VRRGDASDGDSAARGTLLERAGSAAATISAPGSQSSRLRALAQYGVAALIFGCLIAFVARQWSRLPEFDWRFEAGWLALALACIVAFYALQGELWRVIIRWLGEHIDARPGRAVWGKSLLARYVPTNVLLIVGRVVMAERYGVPRRVTLASIVYELGIAVGTALMLGAYFLIDLPDLRDQPARFAVLAVVPGVLCGLHPRVFGPLTTFALRKLGREPLPRTLPFRRVLALSAAYAVCYTLIGIGLYSFAAALHPVDLADLPYIAASYPVAFCVAVATFVVPSGIGTRDAALATALAAVLGATVATAIAVAFRIVQTLVELAYVATVTALGRRGG